MGIGRKIGLTPEGRSHPLFVGRSNVFDAYISHYDEITHMPPNGLVLAGNSFTRVQAVAVNHLKGSFWALQYHPEYGKATTNHFYFKILHFLHQLLILYHISRL